MKGSVDQQSPNLFTKGNTIFLRLASSSIKIDVDFSVYSYTIRKRKCNYIGYIVVPQKDLIDPLDEATIDKDHRNIQLPF